MQADFGDCMTLHGGKGGFETVSAGRLFQQVSLVSKSGQAASKGLKGSLKLFPMICLAPND
jgi:hypothetical protein